MDRTGINSAITPNPLYNTCEEEPPPIPEYVGSPFAYSSQGLPHGTSSTKIPVTFEEPWSSKIEQYLEESKLSAQSQAELHRQAGYRSKRRYVYLSFILIFWASISLILSTLYQCEKSKLSQLILVTVNAIQVFLTGIASTLNLGSRYRVHFEYQVRYNTLVTDIASELVRHRNYRTPADAFLTEIRERYKHHLNAPEFPGRCC